MRWLTGIAAGLWIFLALRQGWAGLQEWSLTPGLLALESALVGYRLLDRNRTAGQAVWWISLLAWASVFLPLLLKSEGMNWLAALGSAAGVGLSVWALWVLGASFGIAPADRGLVMKGPYRLIRHPMYAGALLNALSVVAGAPSLWNVGIFAGLVISAVIRIVMEEHMIMGYSVYSDRVSWRLVPFVW